jgi:hypothetical protein
MEPTGELVNPSEWSFIGRHRVINHHLYWFDIDEYRLGDQQFLLTHLSFHKFTPSVWKRVLREWKLFREIVTAPLYAVRDDGDVDKWEHFVSRLGFKPTGILLPCNNGQIRQLYISTVDTHGRQFVNNTIPFSYKPVGTTGSVPSMGVR